MAVNKYIIQLVVETGSGQAKVKGVSDAFEQLGQKVDAASTKLKNNSKAMQNTAGSAGIAGAATAEFGRLISDLPYGLQAVTNNMSQLGSMFALLVSSAGGTRKALSAMLSTMMGPAGILIAFQAAIAALEYFSRSFGQAEKAIDNMAKAQGGAAAELKAFRDGLNLQMYSLDDTNAIVAKLNKQYEGLNLQVGQNLQLTNDSAAALDKLIKSQEGAARAKAALTMIEKLYQQQIEQEIFLEKLRTDGFEGLTAAWEGFKTGLAGGIVAPELGKKLRINAAEAALRNTGKSIREILSMVGEEGIGEKIFGPSKDEKSSKAKKPFFPFLSDEDLKEFEENLKKIKELQQELTLARIKNEEARLNKELEFINKKLEAEGITIEESLKLQIDKEAVLDKINENKEEAEKKRLDDQKTLLDLNKELILESIDDERERLQQKISFIDEEMSKEVEKTEEYVRLQLEKQKAINALAKAEERYRNESEKEDDRVNDLRSKLFRARLSENEVLERKWLKSQIESLSTILESESLSDEQRAQAELDLYNYKKELSDKDQKDKESIVASIKMALSTVSDLVDSNADRQIDAETNKTNAINDKLKERLATEELTAQQRDEINQQISRNEAALVEKENEINKKRFQQQKALQIAQALVETYRTSWLAFGSQLIIGDPTSTVRAKIAQAVSLAAGLANVAMIARQQFVGKAMPTPNLTAQGGNIPEPQGPAFNVVGATGQNQLAAAIAGQFQQPVKAYVVSSDVTTAQELDRRIVQGASI